MNERDLTAMAKGSKSALAMRLAAALICVVLALVSFTVLAGRYSSQETYSHEIEQLDKRKEAAASMSVVAAAASAGVTLIPDDVCTPIAQQLAEVSKDLGLVTGAVILEKYAMTILGLAVFRFILPLSFLALAASFLAPKTATFKAPCFAAATRILMASLIVWYSIPLGVRASDMVFATYEETIANTIENAELAEELTKQKDEGSRGSGESAGRRIDFSVEGFVDALSSIPSAIADTVGSVTSSASDKVSVLVAWAKVVLTQITEGFAVLVVTTCIIPLAVPFFMFWLIKLIFQPSAMTTLQLPGSTSDPHLLNAG